MIFIYELQEAIPLDCESDYKICYPISEGTNQYKFLYKLDSILLKKIEQIYFIYKKGFELKLYNDTLTYYSAIAKNQKERLLKKIDELNALPNCDEIEDASKRNVIEELIRNQKFVEVEDYRQFLKNYCHEKELIINIPYKGRMTNGILQNISDAKRLKMFSNSEQMKSKGKLRITEVKSELYLEIDKKLKKIAAEKRDNPKHIQERYWPKPLLDIFNDTLLSDLSLVINEEKTRLQVLGEDAFLAFRFIQQLFLRKQSSLTDTPFYHDLRLGVPLQMNPHKHSAFFYFHVLKNNSEECRKLSECIAIVDNDLCVVLQSANKNNFHYFIKYYDIELPDRENIEKVITSVFIAFLVEKNPLNRDYHKLRSLIDSNAFLILLKGINNLENLNTVLEKLKRVDIEKLWIDTDLWYFIVNELRQLDENDQSKKDPKQIILFDFNNGIWNITIHGVMSSHIDSLGIKYLACVVCYYKFYTKKIHVSDLMRLVYAIDNEVVSEPNEVIAYEMDYNADDDYKKIDGCLSRPGKKGTATYKLIVELRKQFISYRNKYYSYNPQVEIEIEVKHPKMTKSFFDPYHKNPLPKHRK